MWLSWSLCVVNLSDSSAFTEENIRERIIRCPWGVCMFVCVCLKQSPVVKMWMLRPHAHVWTGQELLHDVHIVNLPAAAQPLLLRVQLLIVLNLKQKTHTQLSDTTECGRLNLNEQDYRPQAGHPALLCTLIRRAWDTYFFVELELRHSLIYFIHTEVLEEQEACETQSKNTVSIHLSATAIFISLLVNNDFSLSSGVQTLNIRQNINLGRADLLRLLLKSKL